MPAGDHDRIQGGEDFAGLAGFRNGLRAQELDPRDLAAARYFEERAGKWREATDVAIEFLRGARPVDACFGLSIFLA